MKIEIEFPDEDIEKLREMVGSESLVNIEDYIRRIFEEMGKAVLNIVYEGLLLVKAGVITFDEYISLMMKEGYKLGSSIPFESKDDSI